MNFGGGDSGLEGYGHAPVDLQEVFVETLLFIGGRSEGYHAGIVDGVHSDPGAGVDAEDYALPEGSVVVESVLGAGELGLDVELEVDKGSAVGAFVEDELLELAGELTLGDTGGEVVGVETVSGAGGDSGGFPHVFHFLVGLDHAGLDDDVGGIDEAGLGEGFSDGEIIADGQAHPLFLSQFCADAARTDSSITEGFGHEVIGEPENVEIVADVGYVGAFLNVVATLGDDDGVANGGEDEGGGPGEGLVGADAGGGAYEVVEVVLAGDEEGVEVMHAHEVPGAGEASVHLLSGEHGVGRVGCHGVGPPVGEC